MSKFKGGDWVLESDAEAGKDMEHHGYYVYASLPNGQYVIQTDPSNYELWDTELLDDCTVEPRCTGWDWVLPEPLIDGPGKYVTRNNGIVVITERRTEAELSRQGSCPDHIWRGYTTVDNSYNTYRPDGTWDARENQPSVHDIVAKYVEPPTSNRFGLKVGDTVTIKTHDGKFFSTVKGSYKISSIDDTYSDGIARFSLEGVKGGAWHPYWFGLCRSDGSPLSEKPATKKIVLEEWCTGVSEAASAVTFVWRKSTSLSSIPAYWIKTGVTRELEVPNEQ